ncbi:tRNA (guanosine(46)-N7)-methyltransferase TrmB [Synechocystis sp. LKSZ1]|uniref:tRNA (guanosine(46)-N7)-methyltransferase TrmB n=1 Tax=Synechocystis sp. LKSZ1 TaxID=3144951 RepID=UPI00336C288B
MARVRVRQHVNPLSQKYRTPIACPDWSMIYADGGRPLHLDIGCARGKFLLNLAQAQTDWNFLGVEIREPLVLEANEQVVHLGRNNVHFLFGNINIAPLLFLQALAPNLRRVSIQFPDPWFKQRHSKRRVMQPELVVALAQVLPLGGQVFIQSDVLAMAEAMGARLAEQPCFQRTHHDPWLAENPFSVPTEREIACAKLGRPVYRLLFEKSDSIT